MRWLTTAPGMARFDRVGSGREAGHTRFSPISPLRSKYTIRTIARHSGTYTYIDSGLLRTLEVMLATQLTQLSHKTIDEKV